MGYYSNKRYVFDGRIHAAMEATTTASMDEDRKTTTTRFTFSWVSMNGVVRATTSLVNIAMAVTAATMNQYCERGATGT